jgi:hypothetical protein
MCIGTLDAFNREQVLFQTISQEEKKNNHLKLSRIEQDQVICAGVFILQ